MNNKLLKSFQSIYKDKKNIQSFSSYYQALCNWVVNNQRILGSELIQRNGLDILISLNLDNYLIESSKNELCLEQEEKRIGTINFSKVDGLFNEYKRYIMGYGNNTF